jgi:hypothetical protein
MQMRPGVLGLADAPDAAQVGWFAARQPGIVRFLEERLLVGDGDAFGVALEAAWRICLVFQDRDGLPPPRAPRSLLERAEAAVAREARHPGAFADGCAARQPELVRWLVGLADDPPIPLAANEATAVGSALAAVVYSLDELTTGRQVP